MMNHKIAQPSICVVVCPTVALRRQTVLSASHLPGCQADSVHTATLDTTKQCSLSCLPWGCELDLRAFVTDHGIHAQYTRVQFVIVGSTGRDCEP